MPHCLDESPEDMALLRLGSTLVEALVDSHRPGPAGTARDNRHAVVGDDVHEIGAC